MNHQKIVIFMSDKFWAENKQSKMTSSTAVIAFILFLTLLTVSIPLYGHATKTLTGTFQTTFMDKETKNSMIYVGFFMPFIVYSLKVEMGI